MQLYSQESRQPGHYYSCHFQTRNYTRHFLVPRHLVPQRLSGRLERKASSPQPGRSWEISCSTSLNRAKAILATLRVLGRGCLAALCQDAARFVRSALSSFINRRSSYVVQERISKSKGQTELSRRTL